MTAIGHPTDPNRAIKTSGAAHNSTFYQRKTTNGYIEGV